MKLAVFGATGGTGKQLVEQALAAGHEVVAFARDPSKLTTRHERLRIVPGDVTDQAAVECAVNGVEAVISVLGPRGNDRSKPITRGTQNILAAMKKYGVRRFVLSSTPSASDPNDLPDFRFKIVIGLVRLTLRSAYEDIVNTASRARVRLRLDDRASVDAHRCSENGRCEGGACGQGNGDAPLTRRPG